jgi:spore maturation protein CgeB
LILNWDDPQERGVYSGKIFEYLGARRPILSTGGSRNDVVAGLLNETKAGIGASTVEDIKNALKELSHEYKMKGEIAFSGEEAKINKYTHREMAGKFAGILNHLVAG